MMSFFKKWTMLSLLLVLFASLGHALVPPPASANGDGPPEQLLQNGGFEDATGVLPNHWAPLVAGSHYAVSTATVLEGTYSVRLNDPSAGFGIGLRSAPVPTAAGDALKASVSVYTEAGSSSFYLEYWNAADERIGVKTATNTATGSWKKLAVELEAPAGTAYATVLLYASVPNVGAAYFDDALLKRVVPDAGAVANGGFENVENGMPERWTPIAPGSYSSVSATVYNGLYAVRLADASPTAGIGLRSAKTAAEAGIAYTATVWLYNESGAGAYYLEYWNAAGERIAAHSVTGTGTGQWKQLQVEAKAPAGTVAATVLLYSSTTNTGVSTFDDAFLGEKPPEPVIEFPLAVASHPRLYFTSNELPAVIARSAGTNTSPQGDTGQQLWSRIAADAQTFLHETSFSIAYYNGYTVTYSVPPVQPEPMDPPPGFEKPYPYWASMAKSLQTRMETLSLAYAVTGDDDYAYKAKAIALALADWTSWTELNYPCGGTCLDTAHLTMGVSTVYDVLYNTLTTAERQKLEDALEHLGLTPLADTIAFADNNAHALRAAALASGGAALLGENANANRYLTKATNFMQWYFDIRMTAGQSEGFSYTDYSVENMIKGIDKIARTTGEAGLLAHPFLDDFIVRWTNYFLAPGGGGLAIFADAGTNSSYDGLFHNTMSIVYKLTNNPYAGWYLSQAKLAAPNFDKFVYFQTGSGIQKPEAWPSSAAFPEVGWAALRSGWDADDTLLAFNSSNPSFTVGHNHYDQNSFQIAVGGDWIARDPGRQDYNPGPVHDFTTKAGHSTVLVDGQPQSLLGRGSLDVGLLSPDYDYVKGSAAEAYGGQLTRFDRHIAFMKPHGYYVVMDDLASDTPRTYDWVLYGASMKDIAIDGGAGTVGQTVYGNSLYYRNPHAQLTAAFPGDEPKPLTVATYPGAESYGYTVKVGSGAPVTAHRFLTVLKAAPFGEPGYWNGADLLPLASGSSGKELKLVWAGTTDTALYRATQAGDYVEFDIDVPTAGTYDLSAYYILAPIYGRIQVYVDGAPVGPATDLYATEVRNAPPTEHGSLSLGAGSHTLRFEVVSKNPAATGYYFGIDEVRLVPAGSPPAHAAMAVDAERLEGAGVIAAKIADADGSGGTDYVLFRTGSAAYAVDGIGSDAVQSAVSRSGAGAAVLYAMSDGSTLADGGRTLLAGPQPFSASFANDAGGLTGRGQLKIASAGAYAVHLPFAPAAVTLDGQPAAPGAYTYDPVAGLLTLTLAAGTHTVAVEG